MSISSPIPLAWHDITELVNTLGQKKWWTSADGKVKRKEMSSEHKANTLAWLIRQATNIVSRRNAQSCFNFCPDDVAAALDYDTQHPHEWIMKQPFVRALVRDLAKEANVLPDPSEAIKTACDADERLLIFPSEKERVWLLNALKEARSGRFDEGFDEGQEAALNAAIETLQKSKPLPFNDRPTQTPGTQTQSQVFRNYAIQGYNAALDLLHDRRALIREQKKSAR